MLARALSLALMLVGGAGAVAGYLVADRQVHPATLLGWGIGSILAACAVVVAATYAVALSRVGPVPAEHRSRAVTRVAAMIREFLAHVMCFTVLAPFERIWTHEPHARSAAGVDPPVLLVHGYLLNGAAWWRFARLLRAEGVTAYVATVEPPLGSIDAMAESLARRIESVCAASGASRVRLVAHSLGGLVCRAYLRAHGDARVAALVTVASPHHGTWIARLGVGQAARQMEPGSGWLAELADWERAADHPPAVALFSCYDNYIVPPDSSSLPWATNEVLPAHGHVEMYFSRSVARHVCRALRATAD
jgi:triacylglycerol lipase